MRFLKPVVFASGTADRITDNNAKAGEPSMKQMRIKLIKDTIDSENFVGLRGSKRCLVRIARRASSLLTSSQC